ncbi:MAG: hypothetical protein JJU28_08015 [Cyclobacteriaceae bacterium]|nr:hypothetical protein [Cyclobacteriaceae bacterium]
MKFIQGTDRHQLTLFPTCLEDSVDTDAEVRLIDLFVDSLDINPMGLKWILYIQTIYQRQTCLPSG